VVEGQGNHCLELGALPSFQALSPAKRDFWFVVFDEQGQEALGNRSDEEVYDNAVGGGTMAAQSFVAVGPRLGGVALWLKRRADVDLVVEVLDPLHRQTLASTCIPFAQVGKEPTLVTVQFEKPAEVTVGSTYWLALHTADGAGPNCESYHVRLTSLYDSTYEGGGEIQMGGWPTAWPPAARVWQRIGFPREAGRGLCLSARLHPLAGAEGTVRVRVEDGARRGVEVSFTMGRGLPLDTWTTVNVDPGAEFVRAHGRPPLPPVVVSLEAPPAQEPTVLLDDVHCGLSLYLPSHEQLKKRLLADARWAFREVLERAADREGPVHTALETVLYDVRTGSPLGHTLGASIDDSVYRNLLLYATLTGDPEILGVLRQHADAILQYTIHPQTGCAVGWDGEKDEYAYEQPQFTPWVAISVLDWMFKETGEVRYLLGARRLADALLQYGIDESGWIAWELFPDGRCSDRLGGRGMTPYWMFSPQALAWVYNETGERRFADAARQSAEVFFQESTTRAGSTTPSASASARSWICIT
jgi:hypothetical protein